MLETGHSVLSGRRALRENPERFFIFTFAQRRRWTLGSASVLADSPPISKRMLG